MGDFLLIFLGIAKYIQKNYNVKDIPIYASSGGVIPAFLICSEYDIDKAYFEWFVPAMKEFNLKHNKHKNIVILDEFLHNFVNYFNGRIDINMLKKISK